MHIILNTMLIRIRRRSRLCSQLALASRLRLFITGPISEEEFRRLEFLCQSSLTSPWEVSLYVGRPTPFRQDPVPRPFHQQLVTVPRPFRRDRRLAVSKHTRNVESVPSIRRRSGNFVCWRASTPLACAGIETLLDGSNAVPINFGLPCFERSWARSLPSLSESSGNQVLPSHLQTKFFRVIRASLSKKSVGSSVCLAKTLCTDT